MRSRLAPIVLVLALALLARAQEKEKEKGKGLLDEKPTEKLVFAEAPSGWKPRAAVAGSKKSFLAAFDLDAAEGDAEGPRVDVLYYPVGFEDYRKKLLPSWTNADGTAMALEDQRIAQFEANGLKVRTVEVTGTYTHKDVTHKGWRLVAAHVRAPGGQWSAWLMGPDKGVKKHGAAYLDWVKTVKVAGESDAVREVRYVHGAPAHGVPGPWALSGYRIGKNALGRLGIAREKSWEIVVTHHSPKKVQFTCMMDGLLAATGASPGKMNLIHETATEDDLETVFAHKPTNKTITYRLTQAFRAKIAAVEPAGFPEAATLLEGLRDDEIFTVTESAK